MTAVQADGTLELRPARAEQNSQLNAYGHCGQHLKLQLSATTDLIAVSQLDQEARAAAIRGTQVHIDCEDVTCVDLGALQLLGRLLEDFPDTRLAFTSSQQADILHGWLRLMGRDMCGSRPTERASLRH